VQTATVLPDLTIPRCLHEMKLCMQNSSERSEDCLQHWNFWKDRCCFSVYKFSFVH